MSGASKRKFESYWRLSGAGQLFGSWIIFLEHTGGTHLRLGGGAGVCCAGHKNLFNILNGDCPAPPSSCAPDKILSRTYWKLYGRISSGSSAGAGVNPGLIWHLYQADGQFLPLSIDSECIEYFEEIRESTGEHWRLLGYKTICGRCVESKI